MVYAVVAYPSLKDEYKVGTILLQTRRYVADVVVCAEGSDSDFAEIARMAGAQVVASDRRGSKTTMESLLETIVAKRPDALVLNCDDLCIPRVIPKLLRPVENGYADIVEAPWSGFRAFSRQALEVLRVNNGNLELPASKRGLRVMYLSKPSFTPKPAGKEAALNVLTVLGVGLLVMGLLLVSVVTVRLLDGILYLDHALLSIGVVLVGLISALAGRRLSGLKEVTHAPRAR